MMFTADQVDKFRVAILYPGMCFREDSMESAISFISGMFFAFSEENCEKDDFQRWLIKKYSSSEYNAFAWESIVEKIPSCSGENEIESVRNFLNILKYYINETTEAAIS